MDMMQEIAPGYAESMPEQKKLAREGRPVSAGIVAEYNPFHKGHQWMVRQLRRGGVNAVVCVMSGPFVQRAEPALMPTHLRARAALAGGVDLVLRLPMPWAIASAEGFARGGVGLLAALGCVDTLAFGAEKPETDYLEILVDVLLGPDFPAALRTELNKGISFASARAAAADKLLPGAREVLRQPNNTLAVEYIKALRDIIPRALREMMGPELQSRVISELYGKTSDPDGLFMLPVPLAIPRAGAAHDGTPVGEFASASWIREQVQQHGIDAVKPWVPEECVPIYAAAAKDGLVIAHARWEVALLSRLREVDAAGFARHPGAGEGLEARLAAAAKQATTLEELYAKAKTKRFAHSRVRRLALATALGVPGGLPVIPPFAHVLGATPRGLALLREAKEYSLIPVSTSLSKLAQASETAARVAALEAAAEDLHALCLQKPQPSGKAYTQPAAMLTKEGQHK